MGASSDILYPVTKQKEAARCLSATGREINLIWHVVCYTISVLFTWHLIDQIFFCCVVLLYYKTCIQMRIYFLFKKIYRLQSDLVFGSFICTTESDNLVAIKAIL